jgi:hypothetical protein
MARDEFSVEPDGDGFTVGYDDVVAHEEADLVAASADAVRAVPGVREVVHEDRELLLVRTDGRGRVAAADVEAVLRDFWRAARSGPRPWKVTLDGLASAVAPDLRTAGFRKRGLRWNREPTPGFVQVIELGRAEAGDGYVASIDIGLFDEESAARRFAGRRRPAFVQEMDCQIRRPTATFPLTADPEPLHRILREDVLPLLDLVDSRGAALEAEWEGAHFGVVDRAIWSSLEGRTAEARDLLQHAFEELRHARAHLHEVTERCGLPPLVTGSTPLRSRQEDALLPAWVAGQPAALERFRRAIPGSLDGSVASLDHVHRAWRGLVERTQHEAGGPTPTPAPTPLAALPTSSWRRFRHGPPSDPRPMPATQQLTEDLAAYLGHVLQQRVPTATWELAETSSGFEPAITGLPTGTALVVKRSLDLLAAALRPQTPEQQRLHRRYNPIRVEVERWLEGALPPRGRPGPLGRFRRA